MPFGLLHKNKQGKWVYNSYSDWSGGISAAVSAVDKQFVNGNVTVAQMFSGATGAYCVGNCTKDQTNIQNFFTQLSTLGPVTGSDPNNPLNLLWPCPN